MEHVIITKADIYNPYFNTDTQSYTDRMIYDFTRGIACPCSPNKTFVRKDTFQNHWKCQRHRQWLLDLQSEATNFYIECMESRKTIKNQQLLLSQYENELKQKETIIKYLESHIHKHETTSQDLLLFD